MTVAVLCVGLAGVGLGAPPAASAAPVGEWLEALGRTVTREAEEAAPRRLPTLRPAEVSDLRTSAERVVREAPPPSQLTAEQQAQLRQVEVAIQLQTVLQDLDRQQASLTADAAEVSAAATTEQRLQPDLTQSGTEILHDVACNAAFNLMTPDEKADADGSGGSKTFDDAVAEPTAGAIEEYGQRSLAAAFGPEVLALVTWAQYADGIAEKAQRLGDALDGTSTVELPSNQADLPPGVRPYVTRAFAYYARECLRPPA